MTKPSDRKAHLPPESGLEMSVVRAAKVIPAMESLQRAPATQAGPQISPCTGRCGHCDIHPCQLHTTV